MGSKSSKSKKQSKTENKNRDIVSYGSSNLQNEYDEEDRYFRVPFMNTSPMNIEENTRGWWLAHYRGQRIVRQIELHQKKPPILLMEGIDDKHMNQLTLAESGLTTTEGAEILEDEFNFEWHKHRGGTYVPTYTIPRPTLRFQSNDTY